MSLVVVSPNVGVCIFSTAILVLGCPYLPGWCYFGGHGGGGCGGYCGCPGRRAGGCGISVSTETSRPDNDRKSNRCKNDGGNCDLCHTSIVDVSGEFLTFPWIHEKSCQKSASSKSGSDGLTPQRSGRA